MTQTAAAAQAEAQAAVDAAARVLHDQLYPGWNWTSTHSSARNRYRRIVRAMAEAGVIELPKLKPSPERPIAGQIEAFPE